VDDSELARRSAGNFGEMLATIGRHGVGPGAEVRRADAVGAAIGALGDNPWFNAVVVPAGATPPPDDPHLPFCVWTYADHAPGRVEDPDIATPCMGLVLADVAWPDDDGPLPVVRPPFDVVGAMNDRAYDSPPAFGPLAARLDDDRVRTYGLEVDGRLACVAMSLALDDDLGIHYVATEADHRRRGLATRLLTSVLSRAAADGFRSATLQASPDGLPVYQRMGFRQVGVMHGFVRSAATSGD